MTSPVRWWCATPALALALTLAAPALSATSAGPPADPYLWLEEVNGAKPLEWAKARNAESTGELAGSDAFKATNTRFLEITNSNARIPYLEKIGDHYYNFWRDREHERGLWRRTTLAEYRKAEPAWETVIDLDALAAAEKENWVWKGATVLSPEDDRCMVSLSRGGGDATVLREFDLKTLRFVEGGFSLPESKSFARWRDRDAIYVGLAIDSSTMTTSGYPRVVRLWKRGTPLSTATPVYEGEKTDVSVGVTRDRTPGFVRDFVSRNVTFYSNKEYLLRDGKLVEIEKPHDAETTVHREWLFIELRTDWTVAGKTWPAGSLLVTRFDDFVAGKRELQSLFEPTDRKSLSSYSTTRDAVLINELDNVKNRLYVARYLKGRWERQSLQGAPEFGTVSVAAVDDMDSNDYWMRSEDFLTPNSYHLGRVGGGAPEKLKQLPSFFEATGLVVAQHEAISKDGTRVPYFLVSSRQLKADGNAPTLLDGYGGFEIPRMPTYSGLRGSGWLERGGVLAVANIRGGGEFGPRWHQAGIREGRQRVYEDFIAVAEDLIKRGITRPAHLACIGGSNGGLLVGNMLTQRPDLFGAVVCQVPLLDMGRYHKLLAGASWMGEYGNPDDPADWEFIRTWSPYQNVKADVKYPRTLFTTSTRDDRVHPGHARKMVAKMKEQGHDVLYYENIEGGHAGAANNKQQAYMWALAYTFLWKQIGNGPRP